MVALSIFMKPHYRKSNLPQQLILHAVRHQILLATNYLDSSHKLQGFVSGTLPKQLRHLVQQALKTTLFKVSCLMQGVLGNTSEGRGIELLYNNTVLDEIGENGYS